MHYNNGMKKTSNRTAKIIFYEIMRKVLLEIFVYLCHSSHVDVSKFLPHIKETFNEKYIELNLSESLRIKPKLEPVDSHFSS